MYSETAPPEGSPLAFLFNLIFFSVGSLLSLCKVSYSNINAITVSDSVEVMWYATLGGAVSLIVKMAGEAIVLGIKKRLKQ